MTNHYYHQDKTADPDYRMLKGYLVAHHAPALFLSALNRLIERAGIRQEFFPQYSPRPKPQFVAQEVQQYINEGKRQAEIAVIYKCHVRELCKFMQQNGIKPNYGKGNRPWKERKIEVVEVRHVPELPVPVQIISHAYSVESSSSIST